MSITTTNVGARLDRLPLSGWHYKIAALVGAGLFIDLFEVYSAGSVIAALMQSGWSTVSLNATFLSVTFIGLLIGAWVAGSLGDRYGRRSCYNWTLALFGLASIAAAFAPNMQVLIALRFLIGLGLGAEVVVGYATLTEFMPPATRGKVVGAVALVANTAFFMSTLLAYFIIPTVGWRGMFLLPGLAAVGVWIARKAMPESPRWLETRGKAAEADKIPLEIERQVGRRRVLAPSAPAVPVSTARTPYTVLFSRSVLHSTIVGMVLNVTIGFSLYGFLQWLPTLFLQRGMSLGGALQATMVIAIGKTVGALIGVLITDRLGRKPCIVVFSVLSALVAIAMTELGGASLIFAGFILAVSLGLSNNIGLTVYIPELFGTTYRMRGVGLCSAVGRLSSAFVQYGVVLLLSYGGLQAMMSALAVTLVIQAVTVLLLGPETRGKPVDFAPVDMGPSVTLSREGATNLRA